jgi:hypothetical protein
MECNARLGSAAESAQYRELARADSSPIGEAAAQWNEHCVGEVAIATAQRIRVGSPVYSDVYDIAGRRNARDTVAVLRGKDKGAVRHPQQPREDPDTEADTAVEVAREREVKTVTGLCAK